MISVKHTHFVQRNIFIPETDYILQCVTCLLDNESDIRAVFSGVSGASALREVLARLDTQQQALIMGHAVPMPVVIRTRDYGPELYAEITGGESHDIQSDGEKVAQAKADLFG